MKPAIQDTEVILPTLVRQSVVLEDDRVRILDRRVFPLKLEFVDCRTHEEVAIAIEAMVTQSGGPFFAASAGMVLAARAASGRASPGARRESMEAAAARLLRTRPTNNNIGDVISRMMTAVHEHEASDDFAHRIEAAMHDAWAGRVARSRLLGGHAATLIEDGDTILTHCWAETSLIDALSAVRQAGKRVQVVCTETRPYLQGARLTAHSVTVITDGMAAHAMDSGRIARLMTAADRVTLSGHVINKIGTLQLAIAARHFGLPYIAMVQSPDRNAATPHDVLMEERDGRESLMCMGMPTASPLARGWYPLFDVTPPAFVAAIATCDGVFPAAGLRARFA